MRVISLLEDIANSIQHVTSSALNIFQHRITTARQWIHQFFLATQRIAIEIWRVIIFILFCLNAASIGIIFYKVETVWYVTVFGIFITVSSIIFPATLLVLGLKKAQESIVNDSTSERKTSSDILSRWTRTAFIVDIVIFCTLYYLSLQEIRLTEEKYYALLPTAVFKYQQILAVEIVSIVQKGYAYFIESIKLILENL